MFLIIALLALFKVTVHKTLHITYISIYLSIYPSICLYIHLSVYTSIYLSINPSICLYILYLSIHPLSVYTSIFLSALYLSSYYVHNNVVMLNVWPLKMTWGRKRGCQLYTIEILPYLKIQLWATKSRCVQRNSKGGETERGANIEKNVLFLWNP